jgi:two-component system OmpR family sensor kinase
MASVLLVTLVAFAAFDVAAASALRRYLLDRTDSNLLTVLHLARPLVVTQPGQIQAVRRPPGRAAVGQVTIVGPHVRLHPPFLDQYYLAFLARRGPVRVFVKGNPALVPKRPAYAISPGRVDGRTVQSADGHGQLRLGAVREPGGTLVASTSMAEVNKTVGRLWIILIIGSAAAVLVVAAGVVFVLRRGLRPIETMASQADRITAGDLTDRVSPQDSRTEVGRLGTALNGMLARIEASVAEREASQEQTRRFFADASHELRTPLASLRANAELYQQGALQRRPEVDEAMRRITLEATRMSKVVDDMLRLARLDQHPAQDNDIVDVAAVVSGCAERARAADPRRTWRTDIAAGLVMMGDEELLRRAVDNLLANVQAHTPCDAVATVSATGQGDAVTVEVSDDGPGVPQDRLPHIFDRFYRGTPAQARCPGSGLGLAIVAAVAAAHGGAAAARPNAPCGLRVTLTLPVSGGFGPAEPAEEALPGPRYR